MSNRILIRELWYIYKGHLLNRAINAATWLPNMGTEPVSHASLWEAQCRDDEYEFEIPYTDKGIWLGQCWTSTTRKTHPKDKAGTKVRPASKVLINPERWYYTEHKVSQLAFLTAKNYAKVRVLSNKGYSYRDLSRFIMPLWLMKGLRLADNGREICSEHVAQWLVDLGVLDRNTIPSPRRLCKQVVLLTGSPLKRLIDDKIVRDGKWKKVSRIKGM